jgi:hypothetical protein
MRQLLADIPGDITVQTLNIIKFHCHGNSKKEGSLVFCKVVGRAAFSPAPGRVH